MSLFTIEPTCARYYADPPQVLDAPGERSWITRSANTVVVVSQVLAGTKLRRKNNPDEYMLLLPPGVRAELRSPMQSLQIEGESLAILPPEESSVRLLDAATITRFFTARAADLAELAANAGVYGRGIPGLAPLEDWPMPEGGYRIRTYALADYCDPSLLRRVFRSRSLMVNVFERKSDPADPHNLSPHSHETFEQISLALEGSFIHHLRTPWGADSSAWKDDMHAELPSPSSIVIPAGTIHTTQAMGGAAHWLVDVFGPPRMDFSRQPGLVRNAGEYPLPAAGAA